MRQWYLRLNRIGELGLRGTALWGEICVGGEIVHQFDSIEDTIVAFSEYYMYQARLKDFDLTVASAKLGAAETNRDSPQRMANLSSSSIRTTARTKAIS